MPLGINIASSSYSNQYDEDTKNEVLFAAF